VLFFDVKSTKLKIMRCILKFNLILLVIVLGLGQGTTYAQTKTVYKIQVASHPTDFSTERIQRELGLSQDVSKHYINGRYKYFVGSYLTRAEAQADVVNVPVPGAWVVPVQVAVSEELIPVKEEEVKQPEEEPVQRAAEKPAQTTTEMRYRIQVAAEREFIDPEQIKNRKGLTNFDLDYHFLDGWYKYVIGDFNTKEEAEKARVDNAIPGFVVQAPVERVKAEPAQQIEPPVAEEIEKPQETLPIDTTKDVQYQDTVKYEQTLASRYQLLIKLGDDAFSAGKLPEAKEFYVQAKNLDPSNPYPQTRIIEIDRVLEDQKGQDMKKRIKTIIVISLIFVGVLMFALVLTLILRTRRKKREKQTEELRDDIQDSVTEYLFDENAEKPERMSSISGTRDKQVLIDEIMQLYSNLSGEISNRLRELYIDLGLDNESVRKTQSPQWHLRAKGFRELAQMNIKTVNDEIESCLNSENDVLRMEAQLAMVRLNYENPFSFLDRLEKPFTSWEQLHVYEMISRHQINVPDFYQWLSSRNETVVVFSIRMIRAFKQTENYKQLFPLLDHSNAEIREETIVTMGELQIIDTLPVLKNKYLEEDQNGKVLILQAMSNMPEEDNIDFLQSILEPSNALRLEAAEALARIESFGVKGIETILRRSDDDLQAVARHILDSKTR
jgi:tetratricopeptide (TPR) repeat protein